MTDQPAATSLFPPREARVLLWLCVGAICWRWLLAKRAPLPGVDACVDLWRAQRLAVGDVPVLATDWLEPWWELLLAPAVLCGADPFVAAQVLASVLGGLVLWPAAIAAERLRQGAGVPTAVLVLAASTASVAAGAGSAIGLHALLVALGCACWTGGRRWSAALLFALVAVAGGERLQPAGVGAAWWSQAWAGLRSSWSLAALLALLSVLPPRPAKILVLWAVSLAVLGQALATGATATLLPVWSPMVAVLAGVGLARLPVRARDIALVACVAVDLLGAWRAVEGKKALAERQIGAHLLQRLPPTQRIVSDLPRLLYFAGQQPVPIASADALLAAAATDGIAFVVLGESYSRQSTLTSTLAARFSRYQLPGALVDGAMARHITVFARRE